MFFNPAPKATSLAITIALITIYLAGLSSARTINSKQLTDNDEIRLGFDDDDYEFERLIRPSDEYETQLKQLLFPQKVKIVSFTQYKFGYYR